MDLFNPSFNPSDIPTQMPVQAARDILISLSDGMQSVPYETARELFSIAQWDMKGSWIPHSYIGLTIEESIRRAQLKNVVYDQDLVFIVTPSDDSTLLTNILAEKTQNMKIISETGENLGKSEFWVPPWDEI
ncbi:hypothetical protein KQ941_02810 [Paenibacillus xylanexedens]|uniref:hypothetical protein n=1 Tax=Paenibacillus xylanexedens TaxID=528191 RepID=UPI001F35D4F6|nr:hypothetical protein [Paenibacillus xylanexedens]MCF7753359.1 hypothetical protein [Paenibacillus xylanexedens]